MVPMNEDDLLALISQLEPDQADPDVQEALDKLRRQLAAVRDDA